MTTEKVTTTLPKGLVDLIRLAEEAVAACEVRDIHLRTHRRNPLAWKLAIEFSRSQDTDGDGVARLQKRARDAGYYTVVHMHTLYVRPG